MQTEASTSTHIGDAENDHILTTQTTPETVPDAPVFEDAPIPVETVKTVEHPDSTDQEAAQAIIARDHVFSEPALDVSSAADSVNDNAVAPVEEEPTASLSKKAKKNKKKNKKSSGTFTPIVEDVREEQMQQTSTQFGDGSRDAATEEIDSQAAGADAETALALVSDKAGKGGEIASARDQTHEIEGMEATERVEEPKFTVEEPAAAIDEMSTIVDESSTTVDEPSTTIDEPSTTVEEPAVTDIDTTVVVSKKSKRKKKSNAANLLDEDAASRETTDIPPATDVVAPIEGNVVTESDRIILSDPPVSEVDDTTAKATQLPEENLVGPVTAEVEEPVIEERDISTQSVTQESTAEHIPIKAPAPVANAPEHTEPERPALNRKLSKKEKKARKKGTGTPLEDDMVVETVTPAQSGEKTSAAIQSDDVSISQEPEATVEMEPLVEPFKSERQVESVVETSSGLDTTPIVEPVERETQLELDPASVESETREIAAEDEWAPLPKKLKKGKKSRKQSLVSEPVDEATTQRVETAELPPLPESMPVDVPSVEAVAAETPLPEPTPMEVETPATTEVVESRALDSEHPLAFDTVRAPSPKLATMEIDPREPLSEVVERASDNMSRSDQQEDLPKDKTLTEKVVVEKQEDIPAPVSRKASKKSKKERKLVEVVNTPEPHTHAKAETTQDDVEDIVMQESPAPEQTAETSLLESGPKHVEADPVHTNVETEAQLRVVQPTSTTVPEPVEGSTKVQRETGHIIPPSPTHDIAVQLDPATYVEQAPAPIEIDESITRSTSKKGKKNKKKDKKDVDHADEAETRTVEVPASVQEAPLSNLPEEQIAHFGPSSTAATHQIEAQQPLTPAQNDTQLDVKSRDLSPSLQAVRDDAADLRQRTEALDSAVASNEQYDEPSRSLLPSMFGIANLLSKKDKKQVDATRDSDLPDPATPAADTTAAVETTERVENAVKEAVTPAETPSRKLSKKGKNRKDNRAAIEVEERTEPAVEDANMIDAPASRTESQSVAEYIPVATPIATNSGHEVQKTNEVVEDLVITPSIEPVPAFISTRSDDASLSRSTPFEEASEPPRKLSKKDKKRQAKLVASALNNPLPITSEGSPVAPPAVEEQERTQTVDPIVNTAANDVPQLSPTEKGFGPSVASSSREVDMETIAPISVADNIPSTPVVSRKESEKGSEKESKKEKKSRKERLSSDVGIVAEQPITPAHSSIVQSFITPDRQRHSVNMAPSMAVTENLQRAVSQHENVQASKEPNGEAETPRAAERTSEETYTVNDAEPSASDKTFDGISEDVLPTLNKKGSKKHRLAALFEKHSPEQQPEAERRLGHKRSGSVKNLAERFETQSRSATPLQIVPPKSISRATSDNQLRSVSPFDNLERLRSASPRHDVDFAAAVAAGLNESGFDSSYVINDPSFYRSRSTSRQGDRDNMVQDDEVATARRRASVSKFGNMGRASASTSPTKSSFAPSSPTKGFGASLDRILPKGIEVPLAATETPSFDPMDVLNDPAFASRRSPPGVLEEADPEELYAPSKNKKLKGKKKRTFDTTTTALSMQDDIEHTANETPVFEAPLEGPRTVETLARSTARELGFDAPGDDSVRKSDIIEQSPMNSRKKEKSSRGEVSREREERGRTTERERTTNTPPMFTQESKSAINDDVNEYPFPRAVSPGLEDIVVRSMKEDKKDVKSRKKKATAEMDIEASPQEPHKRRSHPVSFHEEQPEEKRLHKNETQRGSNLEPAWSFSALDNNTGSVEGSIHGVPAAQEQPVGRKERQLPQGPRTPRIRSERDVREVEASPALPEYSTSTGVEPSPSSDFVSKERASYLFDSSPSTRAYGISPAVAPKSPSFDSPRAIESPIKASTDRAHQEQVSPTRPSRQTEPYQSIFGDPSEKIDSLTTPMPKRARTPGTNSLGTITENSPDDSLHIKKGRSTTDAGSGERGTKPLRSERRSFSDRMRSSPPTTPTPANRKSTPSALEISDRQTASRDSPWHQANDPLDRSIALSPARRMPHSTPEPIKQQLAEIRDSPGLRSQQSLSNISKFRSPDAERPVSSMSMASNASNHSLRRIEKTQSGDLRAAAKLGEASAGASTTTEPNLSGIALAAGATAAFAAASKLRGEGKGRRASMAETFEAMGEAPRSPMSPTRAPSLRKRQSMQIMDLQTQLDQLADHNRSLEDARSRAEEILQVQQHQRQVDEQLVQEAVEARDRQIYQRDIDIAQLKDTLQRLQEEIARLTELNNNLTEANRNLTNDTNERYASLQSEGQMVHQQWQTSQRELDTLRSQHQQLTRGMEGALREEIGAALDERNAEISRLEKELSNAKEQIKKLQKQILATKKPSESFLTIRDEDYFDSACQQLCQHVQQWVLRFSKFSDTRACRLSSDIQADTRLDASTREKIDKRLDNAILDGSDVDSLLADRVRRRDVFMSIVMSMIWEYVFTRYLFGMDREQRQKLKSLEKTLLEVGPPRAVAQWRAITLTLLSKREPFMQQRAQDTEAVVHEIYSTLSTLLSPPTHLQQQIQASLRNVMRLAVELSIEMRTQRAEYIMLPPLQPEYDVHGDLVAKVTFNASLMNERSGETTSNDELEARSAIVKVVLFPLVVKKGDDFGEGEDEIVVCPAQVLIAKSGKKKVVRVMSGAMSLHSRASSKGRSAVSLAPESSVMDLDDTNAF
ncbi:hypothetical protein C7974DRAFT_1074 [Boeremia exigua]|uniref:uncharacterized protein n=1 Tax=Boeremia exigua TaxID=749465 RepID=UPI001E8EDA51|nr:uncharacterized protein C7974DRAFT_1074 [Boeremia exigua]KAH6643588.1 hypothetical protein C7974DRAFT_1074 [Boeremia exigua]